MTSLPLDARSGAALGGGRAQLVAPALAALVAFAVVAFAPQVLNDPDTYWHLAAGEWILDHRRVPQVDVFSYTFAGKPWHAHEWLAEVLMALAFRVAGWSGLVILFGVAAAAALGMAARRLAPHLQPLSLALTLALAASCMGPSLLARPHLLALPLAVGWMAALLAARDRDRAPPLALAGLMAVWANLHGGHVFGLALIAPFALEALTEAAPERRFAVARAWGLFGLASLAASLATPFGLAGLLYPIEVLNLSFLRSITEWRPHDFGRLGPLEIALMTSLFVMLQRGVRVPAIRLALLLFLLHMALQQMRHLILLGPLAAMLLAEPLGRALAPGGPAAPRPPGGRGVALACALAAAALAGARLAAPIVRVDAPSSPISALAHVPPGLRQQPVFNDYSFGGYLIAQGVRPFIDGRSDMYGEDFTTAYFRAERPDAATLDGLLKRWDVAWTLLPPQSPIAALMDRRPGWRRLYADRFAVVHVRDGAPT